MCSSPAHTSGQPTNQPGGSDLDGRWMRLREVFGADLDEYTMLLGSGEQSAVLLLWLAV